MSYYLTLGPIKQTTFSDVSCAGYCIACMRRVKPYMSGEFDSDGNIGYVKLDRVESWDHPGLEHVCAGSLEPHYIEVSDS